MDKDSCLCDLPGKELVGCGKERFTACSLLIIVLHFIGLYRQG